MLSLLLLLPIILCIVLVTASHISLDKKLEKETEAAIVREHELELTLREFISKQFNGQRGGIDLNTRDIQGLGQYLREMENGVITALELFKESTTQLFDQIQSTNKLSQINSKNVEQVIGLLTELNKLTKAFSIMQHQVAQHEEVLAPHIVRNNKSVH